MIKITVLSAFENLHRSFFQTSLIKRAIESQIIDVTVINFLDCVEVKERIDIPTVGPGPGMIMKPEVIERAIDQAQEQRGPGCVIFFSPQGIPLTQHILRSLQSDYLQNYAPDETKIQNNSALHIILVCARYEGIDARVENHYADLILSIGDYVLMGGDIPAQVFLEGFLRLIPAVVGNVSSLESESFESAFLDHDEFGLPVTWKNKSIPDVLRSGDHKKVEQWRTENAAQKTVTRRFDWLREQPSLDNSVTDKKALDLAKKYIPSHYTVLMHSDVMVKGHGVGVTSITSIDIHDIARSSTTFGVKNFFVVTSLKDQMSIMNEFLGFWHSSKGNTYNDNRFEAISHVIPKFSLDEVVEHIEKIEGKKPILITTGAKNYPHPHKIDYHSQGEVWMKNRPVLFIFGTGQGLAPHILDRSDHLLLPLDGMTNFNHLSVRSAAAIILDRWMGLNPQKKLNITFKKQS